MFAKCCHMYDCENHSGWPKLKCKQDEIYITLGAKCAFYHSSVTSPIKVKEDGT